MLAFVLPLELAGLLWQPVNATVATAAAKSAKRSFFILCSFLRSRLDAESVHLLLPGDTAWLNAWPVGNFT